MCSLKSCSKCGIEKPRTSEFFRLASKRGDGFENICKICKLSDRSKKILSEIESGTRVCKRCGEEKSLSSFQKDSGGRISTVGVCPSCQAINAKERRDTNKSSGDIMRTIREKLYGAKKRSIASGRKFNITVEDLLPLPEYCEILGIKLEYVVNGNERPDGTASLDKVIPDLGYVKGNVRIISTKANRLKSDLDLEMIEKIKEYIIRNM